MHALDCYLPGTTLPPNPVCDGWLLACWTGSGKRAEGEEGGERESDIQYWYPVMVVGPVKVGGVLRRPTATTAD